MSKCPTCEGDGFHRSSPQVLSGRCQNCNGTGEIVIWGANVVSWDCPHCKGTGRIRAEHKDCTNDH